MYFGRGVSPKKLQLFFGFLHHHSIKSEWCSHGLWYCLTSATSSSFSPKYDLLPTRDFLADLVTSHKQFVWLVLIRAAEKLQFGTFFLCGHTCRRKKLWYCLLQNIFVIKVINNVFKMFVFILPVLRLLHHVIVSSRGACGIWAIRFKEGRNETVIIHVSIV